MIFPAVAQFFTLFKDWASYLPPGLIFFAAAAGLENGRYFADFRHEFIGTFLMICCTFSAGKWIGIGSQAIAWAAHAAGVVAADFMGGGPQVNPAVTMAMFSLGKVTYTEGFVRTCGQMAAGLLAFPMFHAFSNAVQWTPFGGPEFSKSLMQEHAVEPFLSEGAATFCLCLAIFVLNFELHFGKYHYIIKQTLTAFAIRALIELFPTAGPAMNPMLATAWNTFGAGNQYRWPDDYDHYLVYWIAPYMFAIAASALYVVYAGGKLFGMTLPVGPLKPRPSIVGKAKKS